MGPRDIKAGSYSVLYRFIQLSDALAVPTLPFSFISDLLKMAHYGDSEERTQRSTSQLSRSCQQLYLGNTLLIPLTDPDPILALGLSRQLIPCIRARRLFQLSPRDHGPRSGQSHQSPLLDILKVPPGSVVPMAGLNLWCVIFIIINPLYELTWLLLQTPEHNSVRNGAPVPAVMLGDQQNDPRPSNSSPSFPPDLEYSRHPQDINIHGESIRSPRAKSRYTQNSPHRSRSHSRPRPNQAAVHLGTDASEVEPILRRPGCTQKAYPIPTVLPPDYPEGTTWVVDSSGWPRLEESGLSIPDQFRSRYGVSPPAVAPVREHPQYHGHQHGNGSSAGVIAPPPPQKPILKRIFGGILGSNKRKGTPGPTEIPPKEAKVENEEYVMSAVSARRAVDERHPSL
ncbi:hypothetical protein DL96DRAFT_1721312 [Flagelloscypha sp. PMI_526]|nr:hypothetical protein DL96DRAFT_1721312 [Flagelloscypha sp. PMI_526]